MSPALNVSAHSIADPEALLLKSQGKPVHIFENGKQVGTLQAQAEFYEQLGADVPEILKRES